MGNVVSYSHKGVVSSYLTGQWTTTTSPLNGQLKLVHFHIIVLTPNTVWKGRKRVLTLAGEEDIPQAERSTITTVPQYPTHTAHNRYDIVSTHT